MRKTLDLPGAEHTKINSFSNAAIEVEHHAESAVMGGDFAGITVKLDKEGNVLPLPELWVPESMLEWGQVPDYVETLVSEDLASEDMKPWTRHVLTILPETGCSVDNMDVVKAIESPQLITSFPINRAECFASAVLDKKAPNVPNTWRLETVFDCSTHDAPLHRVRLSVLVSRVENLSEGEFAWQFLSSNKFSSPSVTISWERQYDSSSSSGTVADGGGLDGQSVGRWMGSSIQKHSSAFATSRRVNSTPNSSGLDTLHLSGNLTLSFGYNGESGATAEPLLIQAEHHSIDRDRRIVWKLTGNDETPSAGMIADWS